MDDERIMSLGAGGNPADVFPGISAESGVKAGSADPFKPAPAPPSHAQWHAIHAGIALGPMTRAALVDNVAAGNIFADDLVKMAGGQWTEAREFDFLQAQFLHNATKKRTRRPRAVSLAAWVMFAIGGVLFLLGHIGFLFDQPPASPWAFLIACCIWGAIFWLPVRIWFHDKMRTGLNVAAVLFLVAAGLNVAAESYQQHIMQQMLRDGLLTPLPPQDPAPAQEDWFDNNHMHVEADNEDEFAAEVNALRRWRATSDRIDCILDYIGWRSFPFVSSIGTFIDTVTYAQAQERIRLRHPEHNDAGIARAYEARQLRKGGPTWYERSYLAPGLWRPAP